MTRFGWVITTHVAAPAATLSAFFHPLPKLIWNASASVPIGLYTVHPAGAFRVSELVVVTAADALASSLDEGHYLPKGVPMLKRVLALPGALHKASRGWKRGVWAGVAVRRVDELRRGGEREAAGV